MPLDLATVDIVGALSLVLETTAFMSPIPPDGEPAAPEMASMASIVIAARDGSVFTIEFVAGKAFGLYLASNLMGTDPEAPDAATHAGDALRELMNVTAGTLLPTLPDFETAGYEMYIPNVWPVDTNTGWATFVATAQTLDVDGHTVAVRFRKK